MPTATFVTNKGSFKVRLMPENAPNTVLNFAELATGQREWVDPRDGRRKMEPLYDGGVLHRVIRDFMIQGGDPQGTGTGGPGFDRPGLLAMANSGPNTNGSQFFVTVVPTPWLTGKHTIFGEVSDGIDVVNAISAVETGFGDRPVADVVLERVELDEA